MYSGAPQSQHSGGPGEKMESVRPVWVTFPFLKSPMGDVVIKISDFICCLPMKNVF